MSTVRIYRGPDDGRLAESKSPPSHGRAIAPVGVGRRSWLAGASLLAGALMTSAMLCVFCYAPRESTMGEVQRIVYLHVAVAWCGLAGALGMGACGVAYLVRRTPAWDQAAQAIAEVGWICATLTLMTGSLWAHEAWNTWWAWEPRLTTALILWFLYAGYFLTRGGIDEPVRRARFSAVLAILGTADVPLVILATRWFRGMHPVSPQMDSRMRWVLLLTVVALTAWTAVLVEWRRRQLALTDQLDTRTNL